MRQREDKLLAMVTQKVVELESKPDGLTGSTTFWRANPEAKGQHPVKSLWYVTFCQALSTHSPALSVLIVMQKLKDKQRRFHSCRFHSCHTGFWQFQYIPKRTQGPAVGRCLGLPSYTQGSRSKKNTDAPSRLWNKHVWRKTDPSHCGFYSSLCACTWNCVTNL